MKTIMKLAGCLILFNLLSCSYSKEQTKVNSLTAIKRAVADEDKALALLKSNCFTCHHPNMDIENRVAPPLFKIREHYYNEEITKAEFTESIIKFINNPSDDNSIMPGAVRNFGLMPKMNFKVEDLEIITSYLYDTDVSSDEWYIKWTSFEKEYNQLAVGFDFDDLARNISNETKAILGKNLMSAVKEQGTAGAVKFCNTRAIHLTDSMAIVLNAYVKRVSDKPRNPINQANGRELDYIDNWRKAKAAGNSYPPKIFELNNKMVGYFPIETNVMCLQCHGAPEKEINAETWASIKVLYPNDKAVGYIENEIRGIFVVEMAKK